MNKNTIWILILVGLFIIALTGCSQQNIQGTGNTAKDTSPIKIGFSTLLTGQAADFGQSNLAGAKLAEKEINDAGGINGRPLQLVVEDDACDARVAVNAFTKLITIDKVVGIVGPFCSAAAGPALPIARDNNIPVVLTGASAPNLTSIGDNIFRIYPSDAYQGIVDADFMYNNLSVRKVAILYVQNDWGVGLNRVFSEEFAKLGGQIVYDSGALPTENDYRTVLQKIQSANADGLYLPLYPTGAVPALQQFKELSVNIPIVSSDAFSTDEIVKSGFADEVIYSTAKVGISDSFNARIHALPGYENLEINFAAPLGYDGVIVMANAIKVAGTDPDAIKQALQNTHYNGISNPLIEFDNNRDLKSAVYQFQVIKNDKSLIYGEVS